VFYAAGFAAAAEFALFGLFTSLAPGFIGGILRDHSHALAGVAAFVVFGAAALAQTVVSRTTLHRQLSIGLSALVAGLFLAAYIGLVVPVLGLGIATQLVSTQVAVLGLAAVLSVVVAAVSVKLLRRPVLR